MMMAKETFDKSLSSKTIPLIEKGNFCRYLATMIRTGTPILEGVEILSSETQNKTLRRMLEALKSDLERGKTLGESLRRFPNAFDEIFLTVVKAGETSGTLDRSLEYLGKHIISDYYLLEKVKGALLYPVVISTAMVTVGFIMFGVVLPRIAKVFIASDLPLPAITKFIFEVSLFFERFLVFIVIGFVGIALVFLLYFIKGGGRRLILRILPKLPLLRKIFSDLDIARFGRILGTLLQSGVPIIEALRIASKSLALPKYAKLGLEFEAEITKGTSLKSFLHTKGSVFPRMVSGMIAIGEQTGTLEKTLFDIAEFYDQEVDNALKNFTTVLEPLLMVIVGIAVALVILSIITPIYSLIGSLQVVR